MNPFPAWPPDWLEDHGLAAEETPVQTGDVTLASALRADDRVLIAVSWPTGRRWLIVDPVGNDRPRALRIGEDPDDPGTLNTLDAVWSQALKIAKRLLDGEELELPPGYEPPPPPKRRWGRG